MNRELKVLVLDDDESRMSRVMEAMPDYINAMASKFVKDAQKLIARDDGTMIDILIMYADDPRAVSLYIFDWMKRDAAHKGLSRIPVIIYTDDAYSDRVMEFLEIDDVLIHEGDFDSSDFFSLLSEAIECVESYEDDFYDAAYPDGVKSASDDESDKSVEDEINRIIRSNPEKLMGAVINAPSGENSMQRSMLITDEDKVKSVLESIKASRETPYVLRLIMQETEEDKKLREQVAKNYYEQELSENDSSLIASQTNDRIREEKSRDTVESTDAHNSFNTIVHGHKVDIPDGKIGSASHNVTKTPHSYNTAGYDTENNSSKQVHIIQEDRYNTRIPEPSPKAHKMPGQKMVSLANAFSEPGKIPGQMPIVQPEIIKKKILVVDTDAMTKLSLNYYYADAVDVDFADSSMKAIDYFIQNKPDIVMIEYDMPFVNGIMILDSIRRQPNGSGVKAVILLDITKHGDLVSTVSTRPGVNGVIYKPFMKDQFVSTMLRIL